MNAIVRAQAWCIKNPRETAYLLSRDGEGYLPMPKNVLYQVFTNPEKNQLLHPQWNVSRIGFQPFPYPSATQFIIDQMKQTLVEGNNDFLKSLDTMNATDDLVENKFVLKALNEMGGMKKFCNCDIEQPYTREEVIEVN